MAGRNISATHVAFASTRVMGTCAVMGQAVGTAAAVAARAGLSRAGELLEPARINALQQARLRGDAFLPAVAGQDPADLAPRAGIRASSEQDDAPARALVNGTTRAVPAGLHPRLAASRNVWISGELPATVELAWPEAIDIAEIHVTFDSGFERELALSMSDAFTRRMIRGPQPETVERYTLAAGEWAQTISGNYQRKRVHRPAEPVRASSLRLTVHATHGSPAARVFEIRVYATRGETIP